MRCAWPFAAVAGLLCLCAEATWVPAAVPNTTFTDADSWVNEGVASWTDGSKQGFLLNSRYVMVRTDPALNVVQKSSSNFIPQQLYDAGYHHCGDTDYFALKNILLLPCSTYPNASTRPVIMRMDPSTLVVKDWVFLPRLGDAPWVAVGEQEIFTSNYWHISTLDVLDFNLNFVRSLQLSEPLNQIQGGAVHEGTLYMGTNIDDTVYQVDIHTGKVDIAVKREDGKEMEGITFLDLSAQQMGVMHFFENRDPKFLFHYQWTD